MVEFTFLEVHFEDADLTANAPYSHGDEDGMAGGEPEVDGSASRKGALLALLVGLGFSIAVAYLVRKNVFGDTDDESDSEFDTDDG